MVTAYKVHEICKQWGYIILLLSFWTCLLISGMGTKLQSESYFPGYYSMRDLNEDSNSCSWPHYYGGKSLTNDQYYNSFISRDAYPGYDKGVLKRTMLEHEDIFKNQVSELHRLYRIQRELMDKIKRRDLQKNGISIEPPLSSSLLALQITSEDAHKWHIPSFPLANYLCGRPLISGVKGHSPLSSVMGSSSQAGPFPSQIGDNSKDAEVLECRPTKVQRKTFDLQLPAEEYIDTEDSGTSSYLPNGNGQIGPASGRKLFHEGKTDCLEDALRSDSCSRGKNSLADLNEPAQIEETNASAYSHFLGHDPYHGGHELSAKPKQELLGLPKGISMNFLCQSDTKSLNNVHVQKNGTSRGFFSHVLEAGDSESNSKSTSPCFQSQKLPLSLQQDVKSVLYSNNTDTSRSEISECLNNKKILGIPIFEKHYVPKNECSTTAPYASVPQPSEGEAKTKGRHMLLDINLPCDETLMDMNQDIFAENSAIEKEASNLSSFRHQFDLNFCVDEDEASFIPSVPSTGMKTIRGIDLEAPLIQEPEDVTHGEELLEKACESPMQSAQSKDDCMQDELVKIAVEVIVAISSYGQDGNSDDVNCNSSENTMTDPLNWFVETISSFGEDLERKVKALSRGKDGYRNESSSEEIDYFESMILNLAETQEEDYMPELLVPENFEQETGATSLLTTRTRKGQGRRGRQRRDFQHDILPGLSSLSRQEVTEDLQTFGGLMRATGYSWHSGVTRRNYTRNGCGRGRRLSVTSSPPALVAATTCMPLMQQLNNVEIGLEDRSLTGWGKTIRRPHRQRCPTGNPPSLALT